ncbi:MAG: bifunctional DNA primase/polymerase, partial [Dehalococcoidia bacterium]|nr:bifunctional DNA primase/polymerase [Dehalococcoidia bacterium]
MITEYLAFGWALTPLKCGTKQPFLKDWSKLGNAIQGADSDRELGSSAGLLLAHCDPPLMTLDVDDFQEGATWLEERGIDLVDLLQAEDAVQIVSGRPGRAKLLYRIDRPRSTYKITQDGKTILEF